jgi:hypothetical protein
MHKRMSIWGICLDRPLLKTSSNGLITSASPCRNINEHGTHQTIRGNEVHLQFPPFRPININWKKKIQFYLEKLKFYKQIDLEQ